MASADTAARAQVERWGAAGVREVLGPCSGCSALFHVELTPGLGDDVIEPQAALRVVRLPGGRHELRHRRCGGLLRLVA